MRKNLKIIICAILLVASLGGGTASARQATWAAFWTNFKAAVAKNDKQTVSSLSSESLSDGDYKQLFGTAARRQCFAKAKPVKDEQGGYSVFCGGQGYYFEKVGGQFKFKEGFAND